MPHHRLNTSADGRQALRDTRAERLESIPTGRVSVEDARLVLLRDCAVTRPDGTVITLMCLRPGSTLARINDRFIDPALTTLKAWASDQSLLLPDVIIWPSAHSMREAHLGQELHDISVAAIDPRVAGILLSDDVISNWKVTGSAIVQTTGPSRKVDHVIDLGDVFR